MIIAPIRSPIVSPIYGGIRTALDAVAGSATQDVIGLLRSAGRKAFFPSTVPETGWWQDSAGTTQAALEQPVGRITDLSGGSFHATQATSLNRPTYTKRVNVLQRTEDLTAAAWTFSGTSRTATTLTDSSAAAYTSVTQSGVAAISSAAYTFSIAVGKTVGATAFPGFGVRFTGGTQKYGQIALNTNTGAYTGRATFMDYDSVTVTTHPTDSTLWLVTMGITSNSGNTVVEVQLYAVVNADAGGTWVATVQGTTTYKYVDLRLSAFSGMGLPAYQSVTSATVYDTTGFRPMLYFDGTSDALATSAIDLSGTDQIMALCNVLKVSDAAQGMVYETTASSAANNGSMFISAPDAAASATFSAGSRGTALATATSAASYAAPNLACLRFDADVSSDSVALLRHAASIATSATDQGTGNYSSAVLYIGARAGASLWFKGYMIPGPLLDTTGIPAALLDAMAREQAALWGVAI